MDGRLVRVFRPKNLSVNEEDNLSCSVNVCVDSDS